MSYGTCNKCGCTDNDCTQCIQKSGGPCYWVNDTHELCSVCDELHTHYLGILEMTYQAKNKLQKDVLEYFESIDRALITRDYIDDFTQIINNKIKEINRENPRCKPLEIYFEISDYRKNPNDIIIRDAHVVHYTIRACETKNFC